MSARIVHTIADVRRVLEPVRTGGRRIGLVPTMGALHAGHARLMDLAQAECGCVVTSIFVNPIQFDRADDYDRYPRTLTTDSEFCAAHGVDFVFAPSPDEMYPQPQRALVDVERLTEHLCGRFRPGHFRGVATVVLKLLNIVMPDRAYFGEKDAQQLAVIRRLVSDLNVPVEIVEVPTVREPDGLALSSRNRQLSAGERRIATVIIQALRTAEALIAGGTREPDAVKREALRIFEKHTEARVEYFEIVDPEDLQPVAEIAGTVRVASAIWIGKTRLIDNLLCVPGGSSR